MKTLLRTLMALVATCVAGAWAAPVLTTAKSLAGLTVYADHVKPNLFYYAPGRLQLKTGDDGAPDVTFLILRYTGSATSNDSGTINFHSYLSFRIGWEDQSAKVKVALSQLHATNPSAQLLPLPIQKSVCKLVATALDGGSLQTISGGSFIEDGKTDEASFFSEKSILLCPDPVSSEGLWTMMKAGGSPIALNCELKALVFDQAPPKSIASDVVSKASLVTVVTDSVSVSLDRDKYPSRFRRVDLGVSAPIEYPAMQILCFDFADEIRPDLFSKSVEIEATGVTGKVLRRIVRFRANNPSAVIATLRFDAAISLKKLYRYRIVTVEMSGKQTTGNWQMGKPWPVALDITTQPGEKK